MLSLGPVRLVVGKNQNFAHCVLALTRIAMFLRKLIFKKKAKLLNLMQRR